MEPVALHKRAGAIRAMCRQGQWDRACSSDGGIVRHFTHSPVIRGAFAAGRGRSPIARLAPPGYATGSRFRYPTQWVGVRIRASNLLATAPRAGTLCSIYQHQAACTSPGADVGAAERHVMDDEGRGTGGLEPAPYRPRADGRARGRGHHFHHRRAPNSAVPWRATYAALDLGTNNCRLLIARPS